MSQLVPEETGTPSIRRLLPVALPPLPDNRNDSALDEEKDEEADEANLST